MEYYKRVQREKDGSSYVEYSIRQGRTTAKDSPVGNSLSIFDAIGVRIPTNPTAIQPVFTPRQGLSQAALSPPSPRVPLSALLCNLNATEFDHTTKE